MACDGCLNNTEIISVFLPFCRKGGQYARQNKDLI